MAKKDIDIRFSKFGTISFTSTTKVNDFIDKLEAGKVSGTICKDCGAKYFPPRADCCKCFSSNMEWFDVSGKGKLLTYSKLEYAPIGFENDLPYCIAVVDFGEYKVFGRISGDIADSEITGGMELKAVVNKLPSGQINYVFEKA
ncbi:MAG: Zn-ribbon domain-containing OB-fold protein [Deltaproteobacteria bacterium]|nr:Zn-ribbon domain-containing OB-fold protein [Deltaproteobacteria bacterium]